MIKNHTLINKKAFLKDVKQSLDKDTSHARLLNLQAVKGVKTFISTDDLFVLSNNKLSINDSRLPLLSDMVDIYNEAIRVMDAYLSSKNFDDIFFNGFIYSLEAFYGINNEKIMKIEKSIYLGLGSRHTDQRLIAIKRLNQFISGKIWTNQNKLSNLYVLYTIE